MDDKIPAGPAHSRRIRNPKRLKPGMTVRRYYFHNGVWSYTDLVIRSKPFMHQGVLRVRTTTADDGKAEIRVLSDMGIVPHAGSNTWHRTAYTIILF